METGEGRRVWLAGSQKGRHGGFACTERVACPNLGQRGGRKRKGLRDGGLPVNEREGKDNLCMARMRAESLGFGQGVDVAGRVGGSAGQTARISGKGGLGAEHSLPVRREKERERGLCNFVEMGGRYQREREG